jgi:hypothetical protein
VPAQNFAQDGQLVQDLLDDEIDVIGDVIDPIFIEELTEAEMWS